MDLGLSQGHWSFLSKAGIGGQVPGRQEVPVIVIPFCELLTPTLRLPMPQATSTRAHITYVAPETAALQFSPRLEATQGQEFGPQA